MYYDLSRHVQKLARDEARALAEQERDGVGHISRLADPAYRYLLGVGLREILERHLQLDSHGHGHVGSDEVRATALAVIPNLPRSLASVLASLSGRLAFPACSSGPWSVMRTSTQLFGHEAVRLRDTARLHGTVGIGRDGHPAMINLACELLP